MPDISALIERWQNGDQRAAESLYSAYRESTFRLAYGVLCSRAEAEDAAQDTLVYALLHIERYDPSRAGFSTWLHTIAISRCRQRLRRHRSLLRALQKWVGRWSVAGNQEALPERQVVQAQTNAEVLEAVQQLSPLLREAIVLRYWSGHTYQEISDIVGCPLRTAQSRVRLAHAKLRELLSPAIESDRRETVP